MPIYTFTPEQLAIIQHDHCRNGRVLAGPGTGKSLTCVALVEHPMETHPDLSIQMLTFTRAATGELANKIGDANLDGKIASTIRAFALRLLLKNPYACNLPKPLRIPDSWEIDHLIRPHIAGCLRRRGFKGVDARKVARLERKLSSKWESLDRNALLLADLEPDLRNAYVGLWEKHRSIFGYTLLAELTYQAGKALKDINLDIGPLNLLVVDEYQDLNEADIELIYLVSQKGVRILAVGDDDQSIYGFRMAAPPGIRRFHEQFSECIDYNLTISQRCGSKILDAATTVIETAPDRPRR
jgi:DNA helicase II / ATP-dependent DNA helicase PcrA